VTSAETARPRTRGGPACHVVTCLLPSFHRYQLIPFTNVYSAHWRFFLNDIRYINSRFTYLLTYLLGKIELQQMTKRDVFETRCECLWAGSHKTVARLCRSTTVKIMRLSDIVVARDTELAGGPSLHIATQGCFCLTTCLSVFSAVILLSRCIKVQPV